MNENIYQAREEDLKALEAALLAKKTVSYMPPEFSLKSHTEWTMLPQLPMNYYSYSNSCCVVNDVLYWFGSTNSSYYKYAYKYDPDVGEYERLEDIPWNFYNGCVIPVGTDIYMFGGNSDTDAAWKYDTLTNTYEQLTDIPSFSFYEGTALIESDNDTIHLLGGSGNYTYHVTYKISTGEYERQTPDLPYYFRHGPAIITPDDTIYIFGSNYSSSYYYYCYCLCKGATQWIQLKNSSYCTYDSMAYLSGDLVYFYGCSSGYPRYLQIYDIKSNTWTYYDNFMPVNFYQNCLAAGSGVIYMFCGAADQDALWIRDWHKEVALVAGHRVKTNSNFIYRVVDGKKEKLMPAEDGWYDIKETDIYHVAPDASLFSVG